MKRCAQKLTESAPEADSVAAEQEGTGSAAERRARRVERGGCAEWRAEGTPIITIARKLGMQRATVRKFHATDEYPEARSPGFRPSKVKPFETYLKRRWLDGATRRQLYRRSGAGYAGT